MAQITLVVDDKVGMLADLSYLLGKSRVTIESISAEMHGGKGVINLNVSDEGKAQSVLQANGYNTLSSEMVVIKIKDEPDTISDVSQKLNDAGVSIESFHLLSCGNGYSLNALKASNPKLARRILAKYCAENLKIGVFGEGRGEQVYFSAYGP
ncbi:MAG: hypothetical protein NTX79_04605 [Candidatus Micrarchaeota archaeon]|nr:hypothetical protein [Candidatus Micrarchaeota archaeon]